MKKALMFLMIVCLLLSAVGCGALENILTPTEKVFPIAEYGLQITADSTFQDETGGSFDLQLSNNRAYVSVMAYKYIDLPEGVIPMDVLDIQNEGLLAKRDAVTVIEESATRSLAQGTVTQALYSAEKDGVKNYYGTYLIDLPDVQTLAWVVVTATPSYYEANRDMLHNIVCSLEAVQ